MNDRAKAVQYIVTDRRVIVVRRGSMLAGTWHRRYIGRPDVLGNPWSHLRSDLATQVGSRTEAIKLYTERLDSLPDDAPELVAIRELADRVRAGERVALECWCSPYPCHGDVLADRILKLADRKDT
jgi:hypothetical protein